jgi:DNA-binding SARP family transcriptional activator
MSVERSESIAVHISRSGPVSGQAAEAEKTRRRAGTRLALLEAFELSCNQEVVPLPLPAQRLLAFLALEDRPVLRAYAACSLWVDSSEDRASGSLRSALWRLRQSGYRLVEATNRQLRLAPQVAVDLREATAWAHRLLDPSTKVEEVDLDAITLTGDLLPDWYDDWIVIERERFRQLRVHALECLCERLTVAGRFGHAMEAGLAAVGGDPLRESAHRALIRVHLAEGNRADALRQYRFCCQLLHERLGLEPSAQMEALVGSAAS